MRAKLLLGMVVAAGVAWTGYQWLSGGGSGQPVTVYKWRDGQGQWHFGNTPPDGQPYETQTVEAVNVLPAVKTPQPDAKDAGGIHPLTPITDPGRVMQLVDDARQVEQRLQERAKRMEPQ